MMRAKIKTIAPLIRTIDARTTPLEPKKADPFYLSKEWRGLMVRIIAQRGRRCEDPQCHSPERTGIRVFGDHIIELRDGGAKLDPRNVMLRCGSCHTRKTLEERARRMAISAV